MYIHCYEHTNESTVTRESETVHQTGSNPFADNLASLCTPLTIKLAPFSEIGGQHYLLVENYGPKGHG